DTRPYAMIATVSSVPTADTQTCTPGIPRAHASMLAVHPDRRGWESRAPWDGGGAAALARPAVHALLGAPHQRHLSFADVLVHVALTPWKHCPKPNDSISRVVVTDAPTIGPATEAFLPMTFTV